MLKIFVFLASFFILGCDPESLIVESVIKTYENGVVYSSGDSKESVTKEFTIPLEMDGVSIKWISDSKLVRISSNSVEVTRPAADTLMVLILFLIVRYSLMQRLIIRIV